MKIERNPFAALLRQRVEEKNLTGEKLAKETDLDSGKTRAILRGDRLISEFSDDLPKLAKALDIPLQHLKTTLMEARKIREKEKEARRRQGRGRTKLSSSQEKLSRSLGGSPFENDHEELEKSRQGSSASDENESIRRELIDILKKQAAIENTNSEVFLTYQGSRSVFEEESEWLKVVENVLRSGVNVTHIIRLDREIDRTLKIVRSILQYVGFKGEYKPYAFNQIGVMQAPYGVLVIPGKEAFLGFATNQAESVDSGVHLKGKKDQELIAILDKHFKQLESLSTPIIEEYPDERRGELIGKLSKLDKEVCDSIIISKHLSDIVKPDSQFKITSGEAQWLREVYKLDDEKLEEEIEVRKQRKRELAERLKRNRCFYVYPKSCIEDLVEKGLFDPNLGEYFRLTDREILEVLHSLIELLAMQNYRMALLSEAEWIQGIRPSFCEVRDGVLSVMEIPTETIEKQITLKWIVIRDPFITSALHEHFSRYWHKEIPDYDKDKYLIEKWLMQQIQKVESRISGIEAT